jgi:uncharacterized protein
MEEQMRIRIGALLSALVLACSFALFGQTPASKQMAEPKAGQGNKSGAGTTKTAASDDVTKRADIMELLELTGTSANIALAMNQMEGTIKPLMERALPPGDYRAKLIQLFFERFRTKFDAKQIIDLAIPEYEKNFTDEELKALIKFYKTPVGHKVATVVPQLTQSLMEAGKQRGEQVGRESMMEILSEHPDLRQGLEEAQKDSPQPVPPPEP